MAILNKKELAKIEAKYPLGIRSQDIVRIFQEKGQRFSAATLRKYVQVGLLPKSKRVGTKGRHRGSSGIYPIGIIDMINAIKGELEQGATLEEIKLGKVGLLGEVQTLQNMAEQVLLRFEQSLQYQNKDAKSKQVALSINRSARAIRKEVKNLERFCDKIERPVLSEEQPY